MATSVRPAAGQGRVGRPPFAFRIEGPDDWVLLEIAPATWRGSVERLLVRLVAGPADRLEELETLSGRALLCGEMVQAPPGELFGGGRAWSSQAYVPVAGTTWTALISGTASGEHAQLLGRLVRRMAGSLSVDLPQRPRAGLWYPLQQLPVGAEDERQGR